MTLGGAGRLKFWYGNARYRSTIRFPTSCGEVPAGKSAAKFVAVFFEGLQPNPIIVIVTSKNIDVCFIQLVSFYFYEILAGRIYLLAGPLSRIAHFRLHYEQGRK